MGLVSLPPGLHALKIIISYILQVPCKQWYLTTHRVLKQLLVLCISNVQGVGGVVSSLSAIGWLSGHDFNETVQDEVVPHLILQWHQQPWLGCLHKLASRQLLLAKVKGGTAIAAKWPCVTNWVMENKRWRSLGTHMTSWNTVSILFPLSSVICS
jgi:hypothetical protein